MLEVSFGMTKRYVSSLAIAVDFQSPVFDSSFDSNNTSYSPKLSPSNQVIKGMIPRDLLMDGFLISTDPLRITYI